MQKQINESQVAYQDRMLGEFVTQVSRIAAALESQTIASMRMAQIAGEQLSLAEQRVAIQEQMAVSSKALEDKLTAELGPKIRGSR